MYNGNKIVAILYEGEITMPDLVSPGVSVTVTDESFYAGAAQGTVPLFVVA